jgi:hypothetical protein
MAILARYEREITLLREHRTRPEADLVTDSIDAREAFWLPAEDVTLAPEKLVEEPQIC